MTRQGVYICMCAGKKVTLAIIRMEKEDIVTRVLGELTDCMSVYNYNDV